MIKAVIFDVDGVLIDSMDANIKFFQDLLVASGYKKPSKPEASKVFHLTMLVRAPSRNPQAFKPEIECS